MAACWPRSRSARSAASGCGRWSSSLPAIEAEFGVDRGGASLPYTATMVGFAVGGVLMGRLADRFGIMRAGGPRRGDAGHRLRRRGAGERALAVRRSPRRC